MANMSLSEYRFASIQKIERFEHWKNHQKQELERLVYLQGEYQRRYADILSFNAWLRSWIDPELQVEREQIVWEVSCIDREVKERKRLLQSHPEKSSGQWNKYRFGA